MIGIDKALAVLKALGDRSARVLEVLPPDMAAELSEALVHSSSVIPDVTQPLVNELATKVSVLTSQSDVKDIDPQVTHIVQSLADESPQLVSFFLSRIDEELRQQVYDQLPFTKRELIRSATVESLPIHDQIFERISGSLSK